MMTSKKIRIIPTEEQEILLRKSAGVARYFYNWTLQKQIESYESNRKFIPELELRKEVTVLRNTTDYNWVKEVSNDIPKQAVKDACDAYKRFFKGLSGFPKFKSKRKSKVVFYNDSIKFKSKGRKVLLSKVGWVKTSESIPVSLKYYNPRVSFDGKYWYVSFSTDSIQQNYKLSGDTIGIDLGIKDLAICSNGMIFKNINKTRRNIKLGKKLKRLQRRLSKKYQNNKEGSKFVKTGNIIKLEKQIKLLHRRLKNIRSNHLHQTTSKIVKTKPSRIVMETLNIKGMMKNRHLSNAIANQGLYEFKRQMEYKCKFYGIEFVEADRWYPSSKLCSECGHKKTKLSLSEREYVCEECGCIIDRDLNASINLSRYKLIA